MLLVLAFLLLLPITLLVLLPLGFALTSLNTLFSLPAQMVRLALDKRRRRNHALEHATVNVLEQHYGATLPVAGYAEADGFFIQGAANPQVVLAAAQEGLKRLQAGETQLALHPRCGTMLVTGQLIAALTFFAMLFAMQSFTLGSLLFAMFVALLAARALSRPVGLFFQRTLTTSTDVQGLTVERLDAQMPQHPFALILSGGQPTLFRIWTTEAATSEPVTPKRYRAY